MGYFILILTVVLAIYFPTKMLLKKADRDAARIKGSRSVLMETNSLFSIDLNSFNPDDYEYRGSETTDSGNVVHNYIKTFSSKEAGIFTRLNVKTFEHSPGRNYIFSNPDARSVNLNSVKKLTNTLYKIYGVDDSGEREFTKNDQEYLMESEFFWLGRKWMTTETDQPHLLFSGAWDQGFDLTVWKQA